MSFPLKGLYPVNAQSNTSEILWSRSVHRNLSKYWLIVLLLLTIDIMIRPRQLSWILETNPSSTFIKDLVIKHNAVLKSSKVVTAIAANRILKRKLHEPRSSEDDRSLRGYECAYA